MRTRIIQLKCLNIDSCLAIVSWFVCEECKVWCLVNIVNYFVKRVSLKTTKIRSRAVAKLRADCVLEEGNHILRWDLVVYIVDKLWYWLIDQFCVNTRV